MQIKKSVTTERFRFESKNEILDKEGHSVCMYVGLCCIDNSENLTAV